MKKIILASFVVGILIFGFIFISCFTSTGTRKTDMSIPEKTTSMIKHFDTDTWTQLFNGKDITGWKHVGPRPDEGYFSLQNHSDNDIVFFKEVAIKSLKK